MITIATKHRVAKDSLDHVYPGATAFDNSTLPAFNGKVFQRWPTPRLLDLGCAGGGLVKSIVDDGGFAVGIEGSDYSQRLGRAEWATIPDHLFTADITQPFQLDEDNEPLLFDIITCWEVFEHIPVRRIPGVLRNVQHHLHPEGVFIVSITMSSMGLSVFQVNADGCERPAGIEYHVTVRTQEWWTEKLRMCGFQIDSELSQFFDPDWVRGPSTGCLNSFCTVLRPIL